jgi:hypothetical protein
MYGGGWEALHIKTRNKSSTEIQKKGNSHWNKEFLGMYVHVLLYKNPKKRREKEKKGQLP